MLQNIRNNIQGVMAKIIIGLIIVPFAVFGIDSLVGGSNTVSVAEINGEEVTGQELQQAIAMQKRRLMNMMGENADPSMFDDNLLRSPALEQLIQQKLLLMVAENASVGVSEQLLDQSITGMAPFQEDGRFSPVLYQNILRSNGMTTSGFKQIKKTEMLLAQLDAGLSSSNFITEKELTETAKVVGQKRSFRYVMLPQDSIVKSIEVSDEDVQQYYDSRISEFQTENRVKLTYIEVKQDDFAKPIAEEKIKEAYEVEIADFKSDEERRVSHILIEINDERDSAQAKEHIAAIAKRINDGEDFASLAKELSNDPLSASNNGDLGFTKGEIFPDSFEEALFALELNQISEPVLTDSGYHLIQATEIRGIDIPVYEDRKAVIEQRLTLAGSEMEFVSVVERLRDQVFNSDNLADSAKDLNLTIAQSDWMTATSAKGVLNDRKILAAAFSPDVLTEGNNSEVLELAPDHFIVVRVVEHEAPRAKALADVKPAIISTITKERAAAKIIAVAQDAVAQLKEGKMLEDIARGNNYQWQVQLDVTRNSASVSRELVEAAFDMSVVPEGKMVIKTIPMNNGDAAIVQLEKVTDGAWSDFSLAQQRGIRGELQRNAANKSMDAFISTIRSKADVKIL